MRRVLIPGKGERKPLSVSVSVRAGGGQVFGCIDRPCTRLDPKAFVVIQTGRSPHTPHPPRRSARAYPRRNRDGATGQRKEKILYLNRGPTRIVYVCAYICVSVRAVKKELGRQRRNQQKLMEILRGRKRTKKIFHKVISMSIQRDELEEQITHQPCNTKI